ncbi:MAG TPA: Uma2 family endonuclease [Thermoanaerobaculia bacterium]
MVTIAPPATLVSVEPVRLRLKPAVCLSDDQLQALCELNSELRIERTSEGDLEIMSPAGPGSAERGSEINFQLRQWVKVDGTGTVFDSSAGFLLTNGAMRAPDTSWVRWSRLKGLSRSEREKFLCLCPDFVVELRSATDSLSSLQEKLEEYMANGRCRGLTSNAQSVSPSPTVCLLP